MDFIKFLLKIAQIGCIGFGGGNALIPVIEQALLKNSNKEEREAFDRDIIVANLTPGALPVEILSSVGRRAFGTAGMIGGAAAFTLPGAVIVVLIMWLLSNGDSQAITTVKTASVGVSAFILCLLWDYVHGVVKRNSTSPEYKRKTLLMITLVCVVVCGNNIRKITGLSFTPILSVSTIVVLAAAFFCTFYVQTFRNRKRLIVAGILCLIFFLCHGKAEIITNPFVKPACETIMTLLALYGAATSVKNHDKWHPVNVRAMGRDIIIWLVFIVILMMPALILFPSAAGQLVSFTGRGALSSVMSFGGGDAYLAIAEGLFVDSGFISSESFFSEIITVVNVTPGSILCKTLSAIGFTLGKTAGASDLAGLLFALAGFGCSIALSCIAFGTIYHLYESIIELQMIVAISRWIRPIVAGLLINVGLSLVSQSIALKDYIDIERSSVLLFIVPMVILNGFLRKRIPNALLIVIDIVAALFWASLVA